MGRSWAEYLTACQIWLDTTIRGVKSILLQRCFINLSLTSMCWLTQLASVSPSPHSPSTTWTLVTSTAENTSSTLPTTETVAGAPSSDPISAGDLAPTTSDPPAYVLYPAKTLADVWREWDSGIRGGPALRDLAATWGDKWRRS